ncbi:hypothetical protein [Salinispora oceanensis]|uniref:hypothetical protein n=1 Tax=Salinispora oceanensis TaxID=1050199 RepID=UPI0003670733|nr:hypothetical protein [Salinispora oceanensis]
MARTATPLTAVDEVRVLSTHEAVGSKLIVATDPYLPGHYPNQMLYPGVFILESVRQTLDALLGVNGPPVVATLTQISSMRLFAPLSPGDSLTVLVTCQPAECAERAASARCTKANDGQVAYLNIRFVTTEAEEPR